MSILLNICSLHSVFTAFRDYNEVGNIMFPAANSPSKASRTPSKSFRSKNPVFIKKDYSLPGKKSLTQSRRNPMHGNCELIRI